jgi:membrane-bound lytic murein transglycosylase D
MVRTLLAVKLRHHRIRPGESLILLARRYGTTVKTLKRLNHLKGNTLIAGRTLIVPNTPVKATQLAKTKPARSTGHEVIVRRGETLWDIAMRYGMKVSTLAQVNGLSVHKPLRPGQTLRIPARYAKARIVHKVKPGESLWLVARRYNTSTQQLKRWNDLKKSMLKPGQELVIWLNRNNKLASNNG